MKRSSNSMSEIPIHKKLKLTSDRVEPDFGNLDDNLLYEIFKHADAKTLAVASCVSKQWNDTAKDERLWELICTRHWANTNYGAQQLRSVVLALGGFRKLHASYLSKTVSSSSMAPLRVKAVNSGSGSNSKVKRWGKDEVNLSLSLLSIRFYEKMGNNFNHRSK